MRAIWSGSLTLGLLNLPLKLHRATQDRKLHFNYLHEKDLSPIRYAKICEKEGIEVPFNEVVRGYEYRKGQFALVTKGGLLGQASGPNREMDLLGVVDPEEIPVLWYEQSYYLEPGQDQGKTYALLREALRACGKVAITRFYLRQQETLGVIGAYHEALLLTRMHFTDEIRSPSFLDLPGNQGIKKKELETGRQLLEYLSKPFHADDYTDTQTPAALPKALPRAKKADGSTGSKDLLGLLKASLSAAEKKAA